MTSAGNKKTEAKGFEEALNQHGFPFHQAVLRRFHDLFNEKQVRWGFHVSEFPVQVNGEGTRIDFVLRHTDKPSIFVVAECKRVNPALARWCFATAPYVRRAAYGEVPVELIVEKGEFDAEGKLHTWGQGVGVVERLYHVGLPVKLPGQTGDASGKPDRDAIESSASQVCRGLSGMVNCIAENPQILRGAKDVWLLPVIFTTAEVCASTVDLGAADLASGTITIPENSITPVPYLCYQYNLSPGIKHPHWTSSAAPDLADLLVLGFMRTIPIVNASGIEQFIGFLNRVFV